jgi:hypothetical protein
MSNRPCNLNFYIGGFLGTSHEVVLEDAILRYQRFERGYVCTLDRHGVEPSEKQWCDFRKAIDKAGVWNWTFDYPNPGVCDGTGWSLLVEYTDRKIKASGSNNFPRKDGSPNGCPSITTPMKTLCKALSRLIGDVEIH